MLIYEEIDFICQTYTTESIEIEKRCSMQMENKGNVSSYSCIYFCFIDYAKAFVWITTNSGNFFRRWEYQTTRPASWKVCMQVKKQQLEMDMEQQTVSKSGKEYKAVYCHLVYLTYMQSTSWEMLGGMKHKLESRLPGEISITSDTQMTPPFWKKANKN